MAIYPSNLLGINNLIEGFDTENPIAIYGPPKTGKSLLVLEQTYYLMAKTGKNAIIVDTEGGVNRFIDKWHDVFSKKYNIDKRPIVVMARTIEKVMYIQGLGVALNIHPPTIDPKTGKVKSAGKVDLMLTGSFPSSLEKMIKDNDVGILVYDSMTQPLRSQFPSGQQNFPAKADATGLWLMKMFYFVDMYNVIVMAVHHHSLNPTNPFATPTTSGGETIAYNFKIVLYLEKFISKKVGNCRKLHIVRFFDQPEWAKKVLMEIDDNGFRDIEQSRIEELMGDKKVGTPTSKVM